METSPRSVTRPRPKNKTALIVDNDEKIQELLKGMLQDMGFEARTTWSGYEALALIKSDNLDVLLVDDYVPDLHFHDLLKRVGQLPIQPWIVVMQAAVPTPDDVRRYALLGVSSIVPKHHLAELCKAISSCCIEDPLARTRVN
jgi:CheY-like chemotaxis protein